MARKEKLSELEYVVLGLVATAQPCTAYRVRMAFQRSPSGHWSGSAGAIYPAVRRLESRGFLRSKIRPGDGRSTRTYQHTPKGRDACRGWLRPPLPDASLLMTLDPLRVRVRFLGSLPPRDRLAFVSEAEEKLRRQVRLLRQMSKDASEGGDLYDHLAHRGAVHSLRAQLKLLGEVRRSLTT